MALNLLDKKIDFPYVLAPMAAITNAPYRRLMKELGAGVVVSELISSTGLQYGGRKTLELCHYFEEERPVGLQIFGEEAQHMAQAGQFLEKKGVDFIDINLGCPVPKVVKKGAGAAMCRDPMKLYLILKEVKDALRIPLTIKLRLGWDASSMNALECILGAAEAGVAWVAIHGRTRAQGYEGHSDWEAIARIKERSPIPIIGNGDIQTAEMAVRRLRESGCDGVMIGRGALRNPFLFLEIAALEGRPVDIEKIYGATGRPSYWQLIQRHHDLLRLCFNDFQVGIQLRKFMTWYSAGIEGASAFRAKLYQQTHDEAGTKSVFELGREFFGRPGIEKQSSFLKEPFLKGGHG